MSFTEAPLSAVGACPKSAVYRAHGLAGRARSRDEQAAMRGKLLVEHKPQNDHPATHRPTIPAQRAPSDASVSRGTRNTTIMILSVRLRRPFIELYKEAE